jgi:subtilisin-like proprotein convertase family protein
MTVNVFEGCQDDAVSLSGEHNDVADEAVNMPPLGESRQICDYDADWYRFSLTRQQNVRVDLLFSHSGGDIDARLVDADGGFITSGLSVDDNEVFEAENLEPGDYLVKVYGIRDVQNRYRIFKTSGTIQTASFTNDADQEIPDGGAAPSVFTTEPVRFDNIPAGAIVRQLKLKQLDINHECLADLEVNLLWDGEPIVTLWNRQGSNCLDDGLDDDSAASLGCFGGIAAARWNGRLGNDICFENRDYTDFGGLDAQGELTVEITDYNADNTGELVNFQVEMEYLLP